MRSQGLRNGTITPYLPAFGAAFLVHALAAAAGGWFTGTLPTESDRESPPTAIIAFVVAPEDSRFPGLNPIPDAREDWLPPVNAAARVSKGPYTFDVSKIAERAQVLFPFLTPGLSWDHFAAEPGRIIDRSLTNPVADRGSGHQSALRARAFTADDAALQRLVDQSWSRRYRGSAFARIRRLAESYSGIV